MYGLIYCATNMANKKKYVGQTTRSFKTRIKNHINETRQRKNNYFHNAIRKHGIENFMWSILCYGVNKISLDRLECYWIEYYDTMNPNKGYNSKISGTRGKLSIETKKKISRSNTGRITSEETKAKLRFARKRYIVSDETRKKMSTSLKGKFIGRHLSEETKRKIKEARARQKPFTENEKIKIAEYSKEMWRDENHRIKAIEGMKNKWTLEKKQKYSDMMKKRWADVAFKNNMLQKGMFTAEPKHNYHKNHIPWNKGKSPSEATKEKIREARKKQIISEQTKKKISQSLKGRTTWNKGMKGIYHHTEETKRKISEAQRRIA